MADKDVLPDADGRDVAGALARRIGAVKVDREAVGTGRCNLRRLPLGENLCWICPLIVSLGAIIVAFCLAGHDQHRYTPLDNEPAMLHRTK
jgi:hypothetical protein